MGFALGRSRQSIGEVCEFLFAPVLELEAVPAFMEAGEGVAPPIVDQEFRGDTAIVSADPIGEGWADSRRQPAAMS
jgi:hypothetical protein